MTKQNASPTFRRLARPSSARSFVPALALALSLTGTAACGPSIDPAAKADIDRRVAMLKPGAATVPAPTGFTPMPLATGQWTQYKMVNDKGQPSFFTQKIIGQEGDAFWIETVTEGYEGRMVTKLLASFGSRTDPGQVQILAMATKDHKGNVNELPREMMPMMQGMYKSAVSMLIINWQGLPQEATVVPAGRFESCFKARTEAKWGPWSSVSDAWAHPAVPLSGTVRSQGVDKPFTMELVAFGTSGAKSEF